MTRNQRACRIAVAVPATPWAPHAARTLVRRTVDAALRGTDAGADGRTGAGGAGADVADAVADAELAVSELVTNALRHGGPPVRLRLRIAGGSLRIEVQDGGPGSPVLRGPDPEAVSGRGLALVQAVSQEWGVRAARPGKIVHATVRLGRPAAGPAAA
ncbi:ATP-binding protein [Kitasatospora sp. NBC_01539]|uniref:ATP-binding protein n=1 Tax=Kitasatospora sp. NBC_01539 TaxID=2903577 RepID=UPI00386011B5